MINSNKLKFYCILACATLGHFLTNVEKLSAGENGVEKILSDYRGECQAMQADVLPEMDADPNQAPPQGVLSYDDSDIFTVDISNSGKKATVVFANFSCLNFGYPWCGSGGCTSYVIVDDNIFEWENGGMPVSLNAGDAMLLSRPISGFACNNGGGDEGFGASPCYEVAVWDEAHATFWSQNGTLRLYRKK